jgi:CRISPR-associated exonuclease Cas4
MNEDEYVTISGLQHAAFCPRQYALIHIERVWTENVLTAEGRNLHDNAHDPYFTESRGETITTRAVPLISHKYGIRGEADVVEYKFITDGTGVLINGKNGMWLPYPVEYKRGKPKSGTYDEIQLCAQVLCLEEMHNISIKKAGLFYFEIRHRQEIDIDETLRKKTIETIKLAREITESGVLPSPSHKPRTGCGKCSLRDECMPKSDKSARQFIDKRIGEII